MTSEVRRDYAGRRDTFKGRQKRKKKEKLPPNLIKLLVMKRLYMSPEDTRGRLNFVVLGSFSWLTLYLTTVQLVWNLIESIPTSLSGLSANVYSHPPLSLLTDGAGDTWTATRLHLLKLRSTHRNHSQHLCNRFSWNPTSNGCLQRVQTSALRGSSNSIAGYAFGIRLLSWIWTIIHL